MKYFCRECKTTGEENFYKSSKYYCKVCWNQKTYQAGKDKVQALKLEYGGKCTKCEYDKCLDALEFHHLDPTQKEFNLGARRGLNIKDLRVELNKCILVCRNCHAEIHSYLRAGQLNLQS